MATKPLSEYEELWLTLWSMGIESKPIGDKELSLEYEGLSIIYPNRNPFNIMCYLPRIIRCFNKAIEFDTNYKGDKLSYYYDEDLKNCLKPYDLYNNKRKYKEFI